MKISRHARNNIRLYKISEIDILKTLDSPDTLDTERDKTIAIKTFKDKYSGYPLKIVYKKVINELFIITAYPLKKKIWR